MFSLKHLSNGKYKPCHPWDLHKCVQLGKGAVNWAQGPSQQGPALQFQKQLIPSTRGQASRDEEGTSERYGKARAAQAEAGAIQPFKCQPFSLAVAAAGAGGSVLLFAVCCCLLCVLPRAAFCFSPWPWICSVLVVAGDISPCPGCVEGCRN